MAPYCPQNKAQMLTRLKVIHCLSPPSLPGFIFCLSQKLNYALKVPISLPAQAGMHL